MPPPENDTITPVLGAQADPDRAIYCTRTNRIIDTVPPPHDPNARLASLMADFGPDLVVLPFDDAWNRFEGGFKSPPAEITKERFWEMLEILPPVAWLTTSDGESFKMCERTAGCVTAIFVRLADRYFTFCDDIRTPHAECCRRVAEHLKSLPPSA